MSEEKPYTEAELTSGVRDPEDVYRAALPGDPANPPARGKLTVIWEEEKQAFHDRLDIHAKSIEALMQRAQTLEAWAKQIRREPTAFTEPKDLEAKSAEAFKSVAGMLSELRQRVMRLEQLHALQLQQLDAFDMKGESAIAGGTVISPGPGIIRRT